MDLIDRFGRAPLIVAAYQIVVLLVSIVVGLVGFGLGSRMVCPALAMTAATAVMLWLTLFKPWDPGIQQVADVPWHEPATWWDPGLLLWYPLVMASSWIRGFDRARERLDELRGVGVDASRLRERYAAWLDDTYGVEIVVGGIPMSFVLVPLVILGFAWFILPK